jgi:pseudouridine synthase
MRLNKLLAGRLGISRRKADELITQNRVTISSKTAKIGDIVSENTVIKVDNSALPKQPKLHLIMLNKPAGYVCSRKGQGSLTIYDLLPEKYHNLNPVGRLDKDSSGLLLLTNDGNLHNYLIHPSYQKNKSYAAVLDKAITAKDILKVNSGVMLDDGESKLHLVPKNDFLTVTMKEGRNRQIRRTFAALGYKVNALHRFKFGPYNLGNLKESQHIKIF